MDLKSVGTSNGVPSRAKFKSTLEKNFSKRDLSSLPESVLLKIFSYLDKKSICSCALLCSTFYNLSKHSSLNKNLILSYKMHKNIIEHRISYITNPNNVEIEFDPCASEDDDTNFNYYVLRILRDCGENIISLELDSCKDEEVLSNIGLCCNLKKLTLHSCKGSFGSLLSICTLTHLKFSSCHFPQKIVAELVKNNEYLKMVNLRNNINVNPNDVCEMLSYHCYEVLELYLEDTKKLLARSLRNISRLNKLRKLTLILKSVADNDLEDSLELLAAGCTYLESLQMENWMQINDLNFIPALRMFIRLKTLVLKYSNISIKSCREAALTLPLLKNMVIINCRRIKKSQLLLLRKDFQDITIQLK